jgi:hypothetical protein
MGGAWVTVVVVVAVRAWGGGRWDSEVPHATVHVTLFGGELGQFGGARSSGSGRHWMC